MAKAVVNVASELIILAVVISILISAGFFMYGYLYVHSFEMQVASYVQKLAMYTNVGIVYYNGTSVVIQITQDYSRGVLYGFGILYVKEGRVIYYGNESWKQISLNATSATINATTLEGWEDIDTYWVGHPSRVQVYPFYVKGRVNTMFVPLDMFVDKNITIPQVYVEKDKVVLVRADNINQDIGADVYLVIYTQVGYNYYGVLYIPLTGEQV